MILIKRRARIAKVAIATIACLLCLSCQSAPARAAALTEGLLHGMVYDRDGMPVAGVRALIDAVYEARSDAGGRFEIQALPFGSHEAELTMPGYEGLRVDFLFTDVSQVLYANLLSSGQLKRMAEQAIADRSWEEAADLIARAKALEPDDPSSRYLEAILLAKKPGAESYKEAAAILEALIADGYKEAYVYLFLADLKEYRLGDPEGALACLETFLQKRYDPEVERRAIALKTAAGAKP